jgi:transcriptional regulator with XRE-family HTH domain
MLPVMATKDRAVDRGWRDAARHLQVIATELREARLAAGLSQSKVGRAVGISHAGVSRIERALTPNVPLGRIDAMAAVVGLHLSVRLYPAGRPLRDESQLALLERLRRRLAPGLAWRRETPVPIAGDMRAWDASIDGRGWTAFIDAETRIRDVQALERRTALKARDTGTDRVILLIADTRSNRAILNSVGGSLIVDALPGRTIMAALEAGHDPGGSGVVLL